MKNDPIEVFKQEANERALSYQHNQPLMDSYNDFAKEFVNAKYAYNFFWMGVPIIQAPQDLQALQEIIWEVKPDLIIETGVAWGGTSVFFASMLSILEGCNAIENGDVIAIDIDIRPHNLTRIINHPMGKKIKLIQGSSIDSLVIKQVKKLAKNKKRILVCLDSNHTHDHVLAELNAYANLVTIGSYCVVQDTGIEDRIDANGDERPWGKGNNPKTAVWEYLQGNSNFEIDKIIDSKLILTSGPDGFLKRVR